MRGGKGEESLETLLLLEERKEGGGLVPSGVIGRTGYASLRPFSWGVLLDLPRLCRSREKERSRLPLPEGGGKGIPIFLTSSLLKRILPYCPS